MSIVGSADIAKWKVWFRVGGLPRVGLIPK